MSVHVETRGMTRADLERVVAIHLAAFPGFFLTFLGARFLRLFYEQVIALDEIRLVAVAGGRCVAFAVGSAAPGAFFRTLLRRRALAFARCALPAVLRRPTAAVRIARALLKPKQARRAAGTATLLSLSVDPPVQRAGIGRRLVHAFVDEARRRGATRVDLTTDRDDNEPTNGFYLSLGFTVARELVTPEGRILNEYELDLFAAAATSGR